MRTKVDVSETRAPAQAAIVSSTIFSASDRYARTRSQLIIARPLAQRRSLPEGHIDGGVEVSYVTSGLIDSTSNVIKVGHLVRLGQASLPRSGVRLPVE